MTRSDLICAAAAAIILSSLTVVAGPGITVAASLNKLGKIGAAAAAYQADNRGYLPVTMSPLTVPTGNSWCTWTYGGKNCDGFWRSQFGGVFDAPARLRPLNAYMYPGRVWKRVMNTSSPARQLDLADEFKDPSDGGTFQRNWPLKNTSISTYRDIGTSYLVNMSWFAQVQIGPPGRTFAAAFHEGTRRISVTERLTPSRFVWNADTSLDVVASQPNRSYRLVNGWGDVNKSCVLYLDGHAAYHPCPPGNAPDTLRNANYDLIFAP